MARVWPRRTRIKSRPRPYNDTCTAPNFSAITTTTNKTSSSTPQRKSIRLKVSGRMRTPRLLKMSGPHFSRPTVFAEAMLEHYWEQCLLPERVVHRKTLQDVVAAQALQSQIRFAVRDDSPLR